MSPLHARGHIQCSGAGEASSRGEFCRCKEFLLQFVSDLTDRHLQVTLAPLALALLGGPSSSAKHTRPREVVGLFTVKKP